jgi:hypothetical protein
MSNRKVLSRILFRNLPPGPAFAPFRPARVCICASSPVWGMQTYVYAYYTHTLTHTLYICTCVLHSLSLYVYVYCTHTHIHTLSLCICALHTYTHTLTLYMYMCIAHIHTLSLYMYVCITHTYTHTLSLYVYVHYTRAHTLSLHTHKDPVWDMDTYVYVYIW